MASEVAAGLFQYPCITWSPDTQSSPWFPSASGACSSTRRMDAADTSRPVGTA